MSSRIKKAKQIVDGKSRFKTAKRVEQEKLDLYVNTIKKFTKTLPELLKTSTFNNDRFEFYLSNYKGIKVIMDIGQNRLFAALMGDADSRKVTTRRYSINNIAIEKHDKNKLQQLFNANRERIVNLFQEQDVIKKLDDIVNEELNRRQEINKSSALPHTPYPYPRSDSYYQYQGTGSNWIRRREDIK